MAGGGREEKMGDALWMAENDTNIDESGGREEKIGGGNKKED